MKAFVLVRHGPAGRAFEMRDVPTPVPGRGQVRIAVEMFGLNFADVVTRLGLYQDAPRLPYVPGFDVVGRVEAMGEGTDGMHPGMRVVAMTRFGGYATHAIASVDGLAPIPEDFDPVSATALCTQYVTAWYAAKEMVRLNRGDRVLIHSAAGGVGTALVQITKEEGCVVVGTTGSPGKVQHLRDIGVDYPLLVTDTRLEQAYRRSIGDKLPDVIFDPIGGNISRSGFRLLNAGGRLVCYGVSKMIGQHHNLLREVGTVLGFGFPHPVVLMLQSKGVIGINMLRVGDARPDIVRRCLHAVVDEAISGKLRPFTCGAYPAIELARVHDMMSNRATVGKLAMFWDPAAAPG